MTNVDNHLFAMFEKTGNQYVSIKSLLDIGAAILLCIQASTKNIHL